MYPGADLREILSRSLVPEPSPSALDIPATRPAAVLVPLITDGGEPRLVFTERTTTLSRHAGEISFPGGLPEGGEDLASAALREAEEEVGIRPEEVGMVGSLPPVHTHVTGMLIVPYVGLLSHEPSFVPNRAEIAEVLVVPVPTLAAVASERAIERNGVKFTTPAFEVDGHLIWGATARIVRSLLDVLGPA